MLQTRQDLLTAYSFAAFIAPHHHTPVTGYGAVPCKHTEAGTQLRSICLCSDQQPLAQPSSMHSAHSALQASPAAAPYEASHTDSANHLRMLHFTVQALSRPCEPGHCYSYLTRPRPCTGMATTNTNSHLHYTALLCDTTPLLLPPGHTALPTYLYLR